MEIRKRTTDTFFKREDLNMQTIVKEELDDFVDTLKERFELNIPKCWNQHENAIQYLSALYFWRTTLEIMSDGNGLIVFMQRLFELPLIFKDKLTPGCMAGSHMETKYTPNIATGYDCSLISRGVKKNDEDLDGLFMDEDDPELLPGRVYTIEEAREIMGLTDQDIEELLAEQHSE